jgi:hypothetical protein
MSRLRAHEEDVARSTATPRTAEPCGVLVGAQKGIYC